MGCGLAETEEAWVKMEDHKDLQARWVQSEHSVSSPRSLPGDLEWRRALDSAGQQYSGVLPDGMRAKRDPEPGAAARAQLNQLLGLVDLLLCLEVKGCVTPRGQGWISHNVTTP